MLLVSIIVPIYNVEKYLRQCIESLVNQTYNNIEIILVNDGSTDNSGRICDEYANSDKRIRVIHKENGGLSSARRVGISSASGDYIMLVDGDDWIDQYTVEQCVSSLDKDYTVELVMFTYVREYHNNSIKSHILDNSLVLNGKEVEQLVYRRLFGLIGNEMKHPERLENMGSCCMKLYKKDVAYKGRYFDTNDVGSSEDVLFNIYALYGCSSVVYLDKHLYHYRKNGESITSTYRPRLIKQWECLFSIIEKFIQENRLNVLYTEAFNNRVALSILGIGLNEVASKKNTTAIHNISDYLASSRYRNAVKDIDLKKLPLPWKTLLFFAKHRMSILVYMELCAIKMIKRHL